MKIMGLTDGVYFASWFVEYLVLNTFYALCNAIILTFMFFRFISFIYVFLLFWLYGMTIFSLAYFFQSFMERTRLALIFSIIVYFIMFFLGLVSIPDNLSNSLKLAASLLPPTGLQLGIKILIYFDVL